MTKSPNRPSNSDGPGNSERGQSGRFTTDEVIADYMQRVDAGEQLDPEAIVAAHPELADELRRFFANLALLDTPTAPSKSATLALSDGRSLLPVVRYFGDYELLSEIARGGMGVVYRARQRSLDRIVAVKLILSGRLASPREVQRFHEEARAAAQLVHPSIVRILEIGKQGELYYYSMEYVAGGSLAERLANRPLPPRQAARIILQIAAAVEYAHRQNVLHRDIKPANILMTAEGAPLLSDFGLAKRLNVDLELTHTGELVGTPSYMAPEQAVPGMKDVGPWTDVYSLGAVLYSLLTGRPPVVARTPHTALAALATEDPVPARRLACRVPRDLETICMKCLEKKPRDRYASAKDLAEELQRFLDGVPIRARPLGPLVSIVRWVRRKPLAATLLAVALVTGLLAPMGGNFVIRLQRQLDQQRRESQQLVAEGEETAAELEKTQQQAAEYRRGASRAETEKQAAKAYAQRQTSRAIRLQYAKDLRDAYTAWRGGRADQTRMLLQQHLPNPGLDDQRDFAWYYLNHIANAFQQAWEFPGGVADFKLSCNGLRLLVQEGQHAWKLFDTKNGQLIREVRIPGTREHATASTFSPSGGRLAILVPRANPSDKEVQEILCLKTEDGSELQRIRVPHGSAFESITFSGDGSMLIGYRKTGPQFMVWRVDDGVLSRTISSSDSSLLDLAVSPAERKLAALGISESGATRLRVWDLATGAEVHHSTLDGRHFHGSLDYTENGKYLVASLMDGDDRNESYIRLWSTSDWRIHGQIDNTNATVHLSPNGERLAVAELVATGPFAGSLCVDFWQVEPLRRLDHILHTNSRGQCMGYARHGKSILVTQGTPLASHQLCEIDIESNQVVQQQNVAVQFELARFPTGECLVAELATPRLQALISGVPSTRLKLSSFGGSSIVQGVRLFDDAIETVFFSECAQKIVATTRTDCVIFDLRSEQRTKISIRGGRVAPVAGNRLVFILPQGQPALFDLDNNVPLPLVTQGIPAESDREWHSVWGSRNNSIIYAEIDDGLYAVTVESDNLVTGERIIDVGANCQVSVSPHGTFVAVLGQAHHELTDIFIHTRGSDAVRWLPSDKKPLADLVFSHDNSRLFTLHAFAPILDVWQIETLQRVSTLDGPGELLPPSVMAESPDGRVLALAGSIPEIHLWDPLVNTELGILDSGGIVTGVAFAPDGSALVAARADGTVQLWRGDRQT